MATPLTDPDPLLLRLQEVRLPALFFECTVIEIIIECLRQHANRALAASANPPTRELSIVLLAPPLTRGKSLTFAIADGTAAYDALLTAAGAAGLGVNLGVLGLLLAPPEVGRCVEEHFEFEDLQHDVPKLEPAVDFVTRLDIVAKYPALANVHSPQFKTLGAAIEGRELNGSEFMALANELFGGSGGTIPGMPPG